jgi:hypothetical protein
MLLILSQLTAGFCSSWDSETRKERRGIVF